MHAWLFGGGDKNTIRSSINAYINQNQRMGHRPINDVWIIIHKAFDTPLSVHTFEAVWCQVALYNNMPWGIRKIHNMILNLGTTVKIHLLADKTIMQTHGFHPKIQIIIITIMANLVGLISKFKSVKSLMPPWAWFALWIRVWTPLKFPSNMVKDSRGSVAHSSSPKPIQNWRKLL